MGVHLRLNAQPHQGYGSLPGFASRRDICPGFGRRGHYTSGKTLVGQVGKYEGGIWCVTGLMPSEIRKSKSRRWDFRRGDWRNAGAIGTGMVISEAI